jgi:Cu-processing system permease protein
VSATAIPQLPEEGVGRRGSGEGSGWGAELTRSRRQLGVVAGLTFREARRRRTAHVALVLAALFLVLFLLGFSFVTREVEGRGVPEMQLRFGYHILLMAGFYVIHFLTVMLTIFSSAGTLSSEIASHTIQSVVTKPVHRAEVVVGKWLGHASMILVYLGLLAGGLLLGVYILSGFTPPNALHAVVLLALEALVLLFRCWAAPGFRQSRTE